MEKPARWPAVEVNSSEQITLEPGSVRRVSALAAAVKLGVAALMARLNATSGAENWYALRSWLPVMP